MSLARLPELLLAGLIMGALFLILHWTQAGEAKAQALFLEEAGYIVAGTGPPAWMTGLVHDALRTPAATGRAAADPFERIKRPYTWRLALLRLRGEVMKHGLAVGPSARWGVPPFVWILFVILAEALRRRKRKLSELLAFPNEILFNVGLWLTTFGSVAVGVGYALAPVAVPPYLFFDLLAVVSAVGLLTSIPNIPGRFLMLVEPSDPKPGYHTAVEVRTPRRFRVTPPPETPNVLKPLTRETSAPAMLPAAQEVLTRNQAVFDRILYLLCPCPQGKQLGEALLRRYLEYVYLLPASEKHHHAEAGGLFAHSLDVTVRALGAFEAGYVGERRPDGTLDNFSSARHRPKWRYAVLVAALLHDAGKVFNVIVREGARVWRPFEEPLAAFMQWHPQATVHWRGDPTLAAQHAALNPALAAHLLRHEDIVYLGMKRWVQAMVAMAAEREVSGNEVSRFIKRADRESAREGLATVRAQTDEKIAHLIRALQTLVRAGTLKVNCPGAEVYVVGDRTAVIVPSSISVIRTFLRGEQIGLPENNTLCNQLRDWNVVEVNEKNRVVKNITVRVGPWKKDNLWALVFPTRSLFSDDERRRFRTDVAFDERTESSRPGEPPEPPGDKAAPEGPPANPPDAPPATEDRNIVEKIQF